MTLALGAVSLPASGVGGCLREGVARRPWMAGGMGTDGSSLTRMIYLSSQSMSAQSNHRRWVERCGSSIKGSDTPQVTTRANGVPPRSAIVTACMLVP